MSAPPLDEAQAARPESTSAGLPPGSLALTVRQAGYAEPDSGNFRRENPQDDDENVQVRILPFGRMLKDFAAHAPAIATIVALLYINHRGTFWFPDDYEDADTVLSLLQLAAKTHDILIIASLAAVVLNTFKYKLVKNGLPLGLVTGSYRVGDIAYLLSKSFWGSLGEGRSSSVRKRAMGLAGLLAFATLLATLTGPSSAILMIPRLDWRLLPHAQFAHYLSVWLSETTIIYEPAPVVYKASPEEVWPTTISPGTHSLDSCLSNNSFILKECPLAGWVEIDSWAAGLLETWTAKAPYQKKLMSSSPKLDLSRPISVNHSDDLPTIATTPSLFSFESAGIYLQWNNDPNHERTLRMNATSSPMYQPLVQVRCNATKVYEVDEEDHNTYFPSSSNFNCFSNGGVGVEDDECTSWRESFQDWQTMNSTATTGNFIYFNTSSEHHLTATLGVWTDVTMCTIRANWVPSSLVFDGSRQVVLDSNITDPYAYSINGTHRGSLSSDDDDDDKSSYPAISFEPSWLSHPALTSYLSDLASNSKLFHYLTDERDELELSDGHTYRPMSPLTRTTPLERVTEAWLGAFLVDTLARIGSGREIYSTLGTREHDGVLFTKFEGSMLYLVSKLLGDDGDGDDDKEGSFTCINANWDPASYKDMEWEKTGKDGSYMRTFDIARDFVGGADSVAAAASDCYSMDRDRWKLRDWETWLQNGTSIKFENISQKGYRSGVPGSTLTFALAVMYVYLAVLVIYFVFRSSMLDLVYCCGRGEGRRGRRWNLPKVCAWDDLQDIFAVAWLSPAPTDNPDIAVRGSLLDGKSWRRNVAVKCDGKSGKMHLQVWDAEKQGDEDSSGPDEGTETLPLTRREEYELVRPGEGG